MVEFRTMLDSSKTTAVNKNTFKRLWWVFVLVSLAFICFGIIGFITKEDSEDLYYAIFCTVFSVLFTPSVWLVTGFLQKSINKSASYISDNTEEVYTFDDDKITVTQKKSDEFSAVTEARYSYLYKVIENKDYYFLYISKMQCHVIDKKSLTAGSLSELNALLTARLGEKFKHK